MQKILPKLINENFYYIDFPFINTYLDKLLTYALLSLVFSSFLLFFFVLIRQLQIYSNKEGLNFSSFSRNSLLQELLLKNNFLAKGFTLIELLVVIAIISILAVMGFAAFGGLTGRGNDDRRRVDLKAISDALEVKKNNNSSYQAVANTDFSIGKPPQEPSRTGANAPKYCYTDGTAAIANPAIWTTTDCPAAGSGNGTAWMVVNNTTLPTISATASYYKICGMDEAKTTVYCFGSRQ